MDNGVLMFDLITYDDSGRPRLSVTVENLTPTLAFFTASNNFPPTLNYATRDIRNTFPVLDFDDSTDETANFIGLMPQQYRGTDVEVRLFYMMTSATSGDTDWLIYFDRFAAEDADLDSFSYSDATAVVNQTVPGTSGQIGIVSFTVTSGANMDNVVAGDMFVLKVTRDASADTASGDAELLGVEIRGT